MQTTIWIVAVIFMLILLLCVMKLKIYISYSHNGEDDELTLQVRTLFGLLRFTRKIPLLAIDDESPAVVFEEQDESALFKKEKKEKFTLRRFLDDIRLFQRFLKHVIGFHTIVRKWMARVSMHDFSWSTTIGTGDAALTGSVSGMLWGIKGNILGIVSNYLRMRNRPVIDITPDFQQIVVKTTFSCMVSFRLGYAILAGIKVLRHWKKGKMLFQKNNVEQTARRDIHV